MFCTARITRGYDGFHLLLEGYKIIMKDNDPLNFIEVASNKC